MANDFADQAAAPGAPDHTGGGRIGPDTLGERADLGETRLRAAIAAARYCGVEVDRREYRPRAGEAAPSPASLVEWLNKSGVWARATRLRFRQLLRLTKGAPVVLLFTDGSAGLLVGGNPQHNVVLLKDPRGADADAPVPVDELRLSQVWNGETLLVRAARGTEVADEPFSLGWLLRVVMGERQILRGIAAASLSLSVLTVVPALMIMVVIDRVIMNQSMSTLVLISLAMALIVVFEMLLSFARRELVLSLGCRLDTKLNLYIFNKLLALPLDYFERNQAGKTTYELSQIWRVREFITGSMLMTVLDGLTLIILLPVLFFMSAALAWMVLGLALLIAMIIAVFLPFVRVWAGRAAYEESLKGSIMVESVYGVRTVKSLALEDARLSLWDTHTAAAADARVRASRLANWPQTLIMPIERMIERGIILVGAYLLLSGSTSMSAGSLVAFMILGGRVTGPLVGFARLIEQIEEVRIAVGLVSGVLNNASETRATDQGLRPAFAGAISFRNVTYSYPNTKIPALDRISFEVPAGTMLGVVGRSGSGKSTITRLLQGFSRDYSGFLKIDGADLREINLKHLRQSFGVVLQDNFLFRGSVRDNIIAGRAGLTLEDAVRAARLAGAEEFIERLPQGYETWVEEGSPNLSGGQKQRLAIARGVINDPRLLILDEATSALDPESEALVNANLLRIAKGRTMVIVSHRLSSLVDCDLILVLDAGTVVDLAPHQVLVERCAIYRLLWNQQNRHVDAERGRNATPALAQGDD